MRLARLTALAILTLALLAAPLAAEAKTSRIGLLCSVFCTQSTRDAFIQGLQEHGYVLGRNLVIDERREVDQDRAVRHRAGSRGREARCTGRSRCRCGPER